MCVFTEWITLAHDRTAGEDITKLEHEVQNFEGWNLLNWQCLHH